MLRLTNSQRDKIKKLAKMLPATQYEANVNRMVIGAEIIAKKIDTGKFKTIDPKKRYAVAVKQLFPVNHEKRLVKAYENGGMEAVEDYCKEVQSLVVDSLSEIKGLKMDV